MVPGELGLCRRGINYLLGAARTKSIYEFATAHKLTPAKEHVCCIIEKLAIYEMMRLKFLGAPNIQLRGDALESKIHDSDCCNSFSYFPLWPNYFAVVQT
jgi:hypothetical protein